MNILRTDHPEFSTIAQTVTSAARGIYDRLGQPASPDQIDIAVQNLYTDKVLLRTHSWRAVAGNLVLGQAVLTIIYGKITNEPEGYLHALTAAAGDAGKEALDLLLLAVHQFATEQCLRITRLRVNAANSELLANVSELSSWFLYAAVVRKSLERIPSTLESPVLIRTASLDCLDFVLELMTKAMIAGLSPVERALVSDKQVGQAARSIFLDVLESPSVILIAEANGEPIGHATAHICKTNEATGIEETFLHDVYVLKEYRRAGISAALTRAIEMEASQEHSKIIASTVVTKTPQKTQRLVQTLGQLEWLPSEYFFIHGLD